jgi:hypothetical protein
MPPGLSGQKDREGSTRDSKSPRLTNYSANVEGQGEIRRLKDEHASELRATASLVDIERGKNDALKKHVESLNVELVKANFKILEAQDGFADIKRRLDIAESTVQSQRQEMVAAEAKYQSDMRAFELAREQHRQDTAVDRSMLDSLNQAFENQKAKSMMFMSQNIDSMIKVEELKQLCDAAQTSISAYQNHLSSLRTR